MARQPDVFLSPFRETMLPFQYSTTTKRNKMNTISMRMGYASAFTLFLSFIAWIACFAGIATTSSLFTWTSLDAYLEHYRSGSHIFQHIAYLFMLITGPAFVLLVNSYHDLADERYKTLSRAALLFATGFAILSCLHYFVQLGAARFNLHQAHTGGLEYFLQANPLSVMNSIVMLGWTLFLGMSSFLLFPVFRKQDRLLRWAFLVNGCSCLLACAGYLLRIDILTFFCINILSGGALLVASLASMRMYRRLIRGA
jgi:hypothetical protein